jgi:hypothetical protein
MSTRRGRGWAATTLSLIDAILKVAAEIHPCPERALAYQLFVKDKLIPSMERRYVRKVGELSVSLREEGRLPCEWIVDPTRAEQGVATWDDPVAYARTVQRAYHRNKWQDQPVHVSVWSEKSTVEGTIRPVLERYEVPFQILHGWSGATPVWDAARANLGRDQRTLILYIGDYDPSGLYMSEVDLPKRLARYSSNTPANKDIDLTWVRRVLKAARLEIRRIALTKADTRALGAATRFPAADKATTPEKRGDSRYNWFVQNHGNWCWELDALSPAVLRNRLERAIVGTLDPVAWNRYVRAEEAERKLIVETCQSWTSLLNGRTQ